MVGAIEYPGGIGRGQSGVLSNLECRDPKCLHQAMDPRFRWKDVIPAKAGIHFGQRIPKFEVQ